MTARFDGKVVLVTGGGSGIGQATARAFAREGATVAVAGRNLENLTQTVNQITADGGRASAITADVTKHDDAAAMVGTVVAQHGTLEIAFNNAGIFGTPGPVADLDEDAWHTMLATNLTGVWQSMKHEIAHMRHHGGGAIVNTASNIGAHQRIPGLGGYTVSKAAVSHLTRAAAKDYIADGIRINAISPGPTDSAMSLLPGETETERATRMQQMVPIGRVGTVDEAAATVLWLASPEAGFAVGHDLVIDGGLTA